MFMELMPQASKAEHSQNPDCKFSILPPTGILLALDNALLAIPLDAFSNFSVPGVLTPGRLLDAIVSV